LCVAAQQQNFICNLPKRTIGDHLVFRPVVGDKALRTYERLNCRDNK